MNYSIQRITEFSDSYFCDIHLLGYLHIKFQKPKSNYHFCLSHNGRLFLERNITGMMFWNLITWKAGRVTYQAEIIAG